MWPLSVWLTGWLMKQLRGGGNKGPNGGVKTEGRKGGRWDLLSDVIDLDT